MPLNPKSVPPDGGSRSQPSWRKSFPIDTCDDAAQSRREFVAGAAIAGGTMACGQAALNWTLPANDDSMPWQTYESMPLKKTLNEMQVGEALLFHYPHEKSPCLLIKMGDEECVAFAQKCTHLACPVIPEFEQNQFHCPCHHGTFDMTTGEPLAGPPRMPLTRVRIVKSSDGTLMATGLG